MTSYSLRSGSPAKTRTEAVVIGVVSTPKGPAAAPGGEAVASAYGRRFAALLEVMGCRGQRGEVVKIPSAGTLRSPLLVLVGLGEESGIGTDVVRRAAGAAARTLPAADATSVTLAFPLPDADHVRAAVEGFELGGYAFTDYKSSPGDDAPSRGEVVVLCRSARDKATRAALETALVVSRAVVRSRDWVNTPPGRPGTRRVRRRRRRRGEVE